MTHTPWERDGNILWRAEYDGPGWEVGCCGNFSPSGECCGNAVQVQAEPNIVQEQLAEFRSEDDAECARRAVNSHDALVEALADFVGMGEGYGWDDAHTGREILMRNARAALALAKGEAEE